MGGVRDGFATDNFLPFLVVAIPAKRGQNPRDLFVHERGMFASGKPSVTSHFSRILKYSSMDGTSNKNLLSMPRNSYVAMFWLNNFMTPVTSSL